MERTCIIVVDAKANAGNRIKILLDIDKVIKSQEVTLAYEAA